MATTLLVLGRSRRSVPLAPTRINNGQRRRRAVVSAPSRRTLSTALLAGSRADDSAPFEMSVENAMKLLGVSEGASFDDILRAKNYILATCKDDLDTIPQSSEFLIHTSLQNKSEFLWTWIERNVVFWGILSREFGTLLLRFKSNFDLFWVLFILNTYKYSI